jgi:hypothetical protein
MQHRNPAQRRYIRRFVPLMAGYVLILFAANRVADTRQLEGATLALLSILPTLPLLGVIVVMGLYLREEADEYLRDRLVVSMLGGTGVLLMATTVWGFLENSGMVGHPPTYLAFPFWCGAMGIVQCMMALRDRLAGGSQ